MTRISSLFVATTLAILPIGAFAQQNADPVKTAAPTSMTTAAPTSTAPVVDKTAVDKTGADNQQFLKAYHWDGHALTPAFEIDFTKEKLGRPHHMKFTAKPTAQVASISGA